jgi:ubiquinone/menaquinone biosynthesis C-methylase UbiE
MSDRDVSTVTHGEPPSGSAQYVLAGDVAATELFNRRTLERDASDLMPLLRPDMRVVDLGCGAGSLTLAIASIVAPGEVLGYDSQPLAIDRARELAQQAPLQNVRFEVSNIETLDLPEARFDVAHFSGTLGYLRNPLAALKLAYSALKSGGLVSIREPQKDGDWFGGPCAEGPSLFFQVAMHNWRAEGGDPCIGRRLAALLGEAGFVRIQQRAVYSAALGEVKSAARQMLSTLERPELQARAVARGWITAAMWDRLHDDITVWAASDASIAAFAECSAIAWKPAATG